MPTNNNQSLLQELQALKMQAKAVVIGCEILEKKLAKEDWPKDNANEEIARMIAKRQKYYTK